MAVIGAGHEGVIVVQLGTIGTCSSIRHSDDLVERVGGLAYEWELEAEVRVQSRNQIRKSSTVATNPDSTHWTVRSAWGQPNT